MKRGSAAELRLCLRNGASWRAGVGWVRSLNILSILRAGSSVVTQWSFHNRLTG